MERTVMFGPVWLWLFENCFCFFLINKENKKKTQKTCLVPNFLFAKKHKNKKY